MSGIVDGMRTVTLRFDASELDACVARARAVIESADRPIGERRRFADRLFRLLKRRAAVALDTPPAGPGGEVTVRLIPSPRLLGLLATTDCPPTRLAAPREGNAGPQVYEVNGVDIAVSERQFAVMELFNEAPEGECVPLDRLLPLYDNKIALFYSELSQLRKKLSAAKSTIGNVRGEGYRLELAE